jgi:Ca2+-transporting ATPase
MNSKEMASPVLFPETAPYRMEAAEVLQLLSVDPHTGLTEEEAAARRARHGANLLTPPKTHGPLVRFLMQFHAPLVYILLAAAAITLFLGEYVDSAVIFAVVLVNAVVGFLQESKALKAIDALARSMTTEAVVVRGGKKLRLDAAELVPGDIVFLQAGDKVPADLRLIAVRGLQIDESALTGESVPAMKEERVVDAEAGIGDRVCMAYSSTLVTYGAGRGVVVATGDGTEIGRISELIQATEALATPLTRKIAQFSRVLLWIILALAGLTFAVGVLQGQAWLDMFMAAVALAVGAIPEGLPAALTITLAIGVARMAQRHAIIRKLPAVETLGSTTVICSDKTGTLTQNEMTVKAAYAGQTLYRFSGDGYRPEGSVEAEAGPAPAENAALAECLRAGLLCNDAALRETDGLWKAEGDPTEAALLAASAKLGLDREEEEKRMPRIDAIPFESEHQYMATLHRADGRRVAYIKGAAETLLPRCEAALDSSGQRVALEAGEVLAQLDALAAEGLRVLLLARAEFDEDLTLIEHSHVTSGLVFLGLQGMIDPPRPESLPAVRACQQAGIQVKMITGDHAKTAAAIAGRIGIPAGKVLTGADLAKLDEQALAGVVEEVNVYARVSPEQKLNLVTALQSRGHVAAMTGDGVNDAPALRRADIGVAMGIAGTEVAKEAADMVLTDDNFASIEAAVEEGRGVYDNLVKFIAWTIPTNVGEGLVILAAVFTGALLPILPVQLLWINMTTAILLGLTLAMEAKEPGLMLRPPRDPKAPILTRVLQVRIAIVSAMLLAGAFGLFEWMQWRGAPLPEARTVAVNIFVFGEMFYLFNCRSLTVSMFELGVFSNPWLLAGVGTMTVFQLLFTYTPWMNAAFHTAPIGGLEWALILGWSLAIYLVVKGEKWLRRRFAPQEAEG